MPKEPVNYKHNVEAVLFSTGRKMTVEEIAKVCRVLKEDALKALMELQADYNARNSSLMVVDEGNFWKLAVRERHLQVVKKIVSETELPKSIIETLAVIAWKAPVLQSDIIKIRTNKAYDHLKELESSGYITRQKKGRTNLIKLTQKFFQYFDLPPEKLQHMFKNINEMEQAILEKEKQIEAIELDNKGKEIELKRQQELSKKMVETQIIDDEIDLITDKGEKTKLEIYETPQNQPEREEPKMKIGGLEVFKQDESGELETLGQKLEPDKNMQSIKDKENEQLETKGELAIKEKAQNGKMWSLQEEMVDKRVNQLLHPETEIENMGDMEEIKKDGIKENKKSENEAKDLLEASIETVNNDKNNKNKPDED